MCTYVLHREYYLGIYAALGLGQAVFVLFGAFSLANAGIIGSQIFHDKMLFNILRSPMSFFDTTPLGRILNRFSKDIYTVDELIPMSNRSFLYTFFHTISTLVVIMVAVPIFATVIFPLGILYFFFQVRTYVHVLCTHSLFNDT